MATDNRLIVITGPTASGKTSLAIELAEQYGGEIICADSRTVYRGMDIGTAKPTKADQARVRHHLLDVANPDERFTAADFQRLARAAIADIRSRGKIPFVVGGTGLYIDGLILNYQFGDKSDEALRAKLESLSVEELIAMIKKQHISVPENSQNKRYLVRALEQSTINNNRLSEPESGTMVVAIATEKAELLERISKRAMQIFEGPIIDETKTLVSRYGWDHESMSGNVYPLVHEMMNGTLTTQHAIEQSIINDWQLAKRQITWLKRHDYVRWCTLTEARTYIEAVLE
jgi:tRNA dimethylallyltransferase